MIRSEIFLFFFVHTLKHYQLSAVIHCFIIAKVKLSVSLIILCMFTAWKGHFRNHLRGFGWDV